MVGCSGKQRRRSRWPVGGAALACLGLSRGALAAEDLAPDIAARIGTALEVVERLRAGLEASIAAFADLPVALAFGLMLTIGAAAEWLTRRSWRRSSRPSPTATSPSASAWPTRTRARGGWSS
jgi:hypothetical protein